MGNAEARVDSGQGVGKMVVAGLGARRAAGRARGRHPQPERKSHQRAAEGQWFGRAPTCPPPTCGRWAGCCTCGWRVPARCPARPDAERLDGLLGRRRGHRQRGTAARDHGPGLRFRPTVSWGRSARSRAWGTGRLGSEMLRRIPEGQSAVSGTADRAGAVASTGGPAPYRWGTRRPRGRPDHQDQAPGSRYARRTLGPRRISAGGLFHD